MSIYAIGDIQGCYRPFIDLLEKISFNPKTDQLWIAGDVINRGPESLKTLLFLNSISDSCIITLGNHDIHALAAYYTTKRKLRENDTLDELFNHPQASELMEWLRHQKILHYDQYYNFAICHAGIYPAWDINQALQFSQQIENCLQSENFTTFLEQAFGSFPEYWDNNFEQIDKLRFILNTFTRMRFCYLNNDNTSNKINLDFKYKATIDSAPPEMIPWFKFPHRKTQEINILFGHWAALNGVTNTPRVYALDTGCCWGKKLTSFCVNNLLRTAIECNNNDH